MAEEMSTSDLKGEFNVAHHSIHYSLSRAPLRSASFVEAVYSIWEQPQVSESSLFLRKVLRERTGGQIIALTASAGLKPQSPPPNTRSRLEFQISHLQAR